MSHIELIYAFLGGWWIFAEINKKNISFMVKKVFFSSKWATDQNKAFQVFETIFAEIDTKKNLSLRSKKVFFSSK